MSREGTTHLLGQILYKTFVPTDLTIFVYKQRLDSGCGSVGRAVAADTRGPRFKSNHCQNC